MNGTHPLPGGAKSVLSAVRGFLKRRADQKLDAKLDECLKGDLSLDDERLLKILLGRYDEVERINNSLADGAIRAGASAQAMEKERD